jgi:hypothetical protein
MNSEQQKLMRHYADKSILWDSLKHDVECMMLYHRALSQESRIHETYQCVLEKMRDMEAKMKADRDSESPQS